MTLKTTLQQCSSLIWYFYVPGRYYIDPDRPIKLVILLVRTQTTWLAQKNLFLTIINDEYAAEISSTNYPHEFGLILRASRYSNIWNMCHGHNDTVVIIKVANTNEILRGYNSLMWDSTTVGKWMHTNDSFIFALKNET